MRAIRREPGSIRWRFEVILELAGCFWDMRPVGRTSPPDAFRRVAVFGDQAAGNSAAGTKTAAAAAELPNGEAPRPDDDWTDLANQSQPAGGMHITWCSHRLWWQLQGDTDLGVGGVATPPFESVRGLC